MHNVKCASQSHFPFAHCVAYDLWHYSFTIELIFAFKSRPFLRRQRCQFCLLLSHFLDWIGLIQIFYFFCIKSRRFFSESHTQEIYSSAKFTAWWQYDEFSFYLSIIGFIACERDHNCTWGTSRLSHTKVNQSQWQWNSILVNFKWSFSLVINVDTDEKKETVDSHIKMDFIIWDDTDC